MSWIGRTIAAGLVGVFALGSGGVTAADESPEEECLEALTKTTGNRRKKVLQACLDAIAAQGVPQLEWVATWSDGLPEKLKRFEEAREPEAHDAREHKGGPPRREIGPGRNRWDDLDAKLERRPADPRAAAWRPVEYEFATGEIVAPDPRAKPDKVQEFRDLLSGRLPDRVRAEAALLAALDAEGPFQVEADYFAHLYCDRDGNAYEGITLFDYWSSGFVVEVPDVDVRAFAHLVWQVEEDIPESLTDNDHRLWYPRIQESLKNLRTYMFTVRALAAVWFEGKPELGGGYERSVDILNASIALCDGDPACLAKKLAEHRHDFLVAMKEEIDAEGHEVWNRGNARRDEVAEASQKLREAVRSVLVEEGYLELE